MKNKYNVLIAILLFLISLIIIYFFLPPKDVKPSPKDPKPTITYSNNNITLKVGEVKKIEPTITNLDNYILEWSSSNNNVIEVNNGLIIAKSSGKAIITVKIKNYDVSLSINITVSDIDIEKIKFDINNIELVEDDTYDLKYMILPSNATKRNITVDISNKDVISYNNYQVKALSKGESIITIKSYNGLSDSCTVIVKEKNIPVTDIKIDKNNYILYIGDSVTLNPIVVPDNATNKKIIYRSSNSNIATINNKVIKGIKEGVATITLKSNNDITKKIKVTVKKKPVNLNVASINLGAYHCGTSSTSCKATPENFANLFKNYKLNIVGMQESEPESKTKKIPKLSGLTNYFYVRPASSNTIISNYKFISKNEYILPSCGEKRVLQRVVIMVNDVKISFYNSHFSYQSACHDKHFKAVADILKKDSNPSIMLGDLNINDDTYFKKYFKSLGFEIAAYDSSSNNLHKHPTYCNAIYVKGNNHITIKSGKHIETFGKYTDHNMTFASLDVS